MSGSGGIGGNGGVSAGSNVTSDGDSNLVGGNGGNGGDSSSGSGGTPGSGGAGGSSGSGGSTVTVPEYKVEVTVKTEGGSAAIGAQVSIMRGEESLAFGVTDIHGVIGFEGVSPGVYNVVVQYDDKIVTTKVVVIERNVEVTAVIESDSTGTGNLNTQVTGEVPVVPEKLETVTNTGETANGSHVTITLNATVQKDSNVIDSISNKAKDQNITMVDFVDVTITKTVTKDNVSEEFVIPNTSGLMTFYMEVSKAMWDSLDDKGPEHIKLYREHTGNGQTDINDIRKVSNKYYADRWGGECYYIEYSADRNIVYIVVVAEKFSTYALGYQDTPVSPNNPSSGGSGGTDPSKPTIEVGSDIVDGKVMITVTPEKDKEYAVLDKDGNVVGDWVSGSSGEDIVFGPFEPGQDYTIVSKDKDGKEKVEATVTTPKAPGHSVTDKGDNSVSIDTDTGAKYQVTDKDGNPVPGPDGSVWVEGTGGSLTWDGLDPEKDYYVTIQVVDPVTGETLVYGPFLVKDGTESPGPGPDPEPEPGPGEGTDDGKGCHAWAVLLVLVVYVAFLLLVHREGPFDLLTWAATIAALVIDAVVVALHGCAWDIAALVATIAVMGLAWYHFRGKPSSGDGEDRS